MSDQYPELNDPIKIPDFYILERTTPLGEIAAGFTVELGAPELPTGEVVVGSLNREAFHRTAMTVTASEIQPDGSRYIDISRADHAPFNVIDADAIDIPGSPRALTAPADYVRLQRGGESGIWSVAFAPHESLQVDEHPEDTIPDDQNVLRAFCTKIGQFTIVKQRESQELKPDLPQITE